jgi:hypothetical protein
MVSSRSEARSLFARQLLRLEKPRIAGESRDAYLARVLSGKRARAVRQFLHQRERQKAKRLARQRLPDLSKFCSRADPHASTVVSQRVRKQEPEQILALLLERAPQLSDKLKLLHEVLTAGGYETAACFAAQLESEVLLASPALRAQAVPILTRVWMTTGEAQRALAFWTKAGSDLPADHPLRQALLVGLGRLDAPRFIASGAFLPYLACSALQQGHAEQVLDSLFASPSAILLNPELELLLHNALGAKEPHPLTALNRFFARHHLGRAELVSRPASANWLSRLSFAPRAPVRAGPLVSVIMSARNARHTIAYAIDSILGQTYRSLELLIADDGSHDETYDFVLQHYAHDPRVRLFRSRENQGTYNARNQLIAEARGELITFQDADDLSLPTRIASQVRAIGRAGRVASIGEWLRVRPDGNIAFFPNGRAARLCMVSLMVTRCALSGVGPYPSAKIGADLDVYRRILRAHGGERVVRLPLPLALGLWSDQSLTRSQQQQSLESGYRAPARRRYSELVFRQDLFGSHSLSDAELHEELVAMDNYIEPSALLPHSKPLIG